MSTLQQSGNIMKKIFTAIFAALASLSGAQAQGINPIMPPTNWLITVTAPAFANPSNFYTTPALLGSIIGNFPPTGCSTANGVIFNNATPCDSGLTYAGGGGQLALTGGAIAAVTALLVNPASASGGNLLDLQIGGSSKFKVDDTGVATFSQAIISTNVQIAASQPLRWSNGSQLLSSASGVFVFQSNAAGNTATVTLSGGTNGTFGLTGTIAATLATAVGADVVCNAGTATSALTIQVSATGCAASSARFKESIAFIDNARAFDTVMSLQPVSYFYKKEYDPNDKAKHIGFIAEQANELTPPVDGYTMVTTEKDSEQLHGFKYNEMTPLLVGAFQQAIARFEERFSQLRAEIQALKDSK